MLDVNTRVISSLVTALCLLLPANESFAQVDLGVIGDSLFDEHFNQTEFGASLSYSKNALELLNDAGVFNLGTIDNWGGTRGNGYEFNWALAGATTETLISQGQHTNLASQIDARGITHAVMVIGSNDLFPGTPSFGSTYELVYESIASQAQIDAFIDSAVDRMILASETLADTGVNLLFATAPDYGIAPITKSRYPDPVKRQLVTDVLAEANERASQILRTELGVPVIDIFAATKDIFGENGQENSIVTIGGVAIDLNGTGGVEYSDVLDGSYNPNNLTSDVADAFAHDGIHPSNVLGGIYANMLLTGFNEEYGDTFPLFTEQEILNNAGPNLGSQYLSDTFLAELAADYSDYVLLASNSGLIGDFNGDDIVDVADIDAYFGNIDSAATGALAALDLDGDELITLDDHRFLIENLVETSVGVGTFVGDFTLDGQVNVLQDASTLISNLNGGAGPYFWSDGDSNADGVLDVLNDGANVINNLGMSTGSASANTSAIPEPSTGLLTGLILSTAALSRRRARSA